jgi:hypothetical protein
MADLGNEEKLIIELEKVYNYLMGAHHATSDENSSSCFHMACHKLDDVINLLKRWKAESDILNR